MSEIKPNPAARWADYVKGVLAQLRKRGVNFSGFNAAIHGTIPIGAGMSSSAALEVELCYVGQSYPLRIRVPADRRDVFDRIEAEFYRLHRGLYGFASPDEATMIVNLRVTAPGKVDRPRLRTLTRGDGDPAQALKGRRVAIFGHDSMGMETALAHVIPSRRQFGIEITLAWT